MNLFGSSEDMNIYIYIYIYISFFFLLWSYSSWNKMKKKLNEKKKGFLATGWAIAHFPVLVMIQHIVS